MRLRRSEVLNDCFGPETAHEERSLRGSSFLNVALTNLHSRHAMNVAHRAVFKVWPVLLLQDTLVTFIELWMITRNSLTFTSLAAQDIRNGKHEQLQVARLQRHYHANHENGSRCILIAGSQILHTFPHAASFRFSDMWCLRDSSRRPSWMPIQDPECGLHTPCWRLSCNPFVRDCVVRPFRSAS